jgi:hypothetical protein
MFIASDENNAVTRVRLESDESKIARVAEIGAGAGSGWFCEGEGVSVRSGKDMDGNDDVREDCTSSHFWDSSPVSCLECEGRRLVLAGGGARLHWGYSLD